MNEFRLLPGDGRNIRRNALIRALFFGVCYLSIAFMVHSIRQGQLAAPDGFPYFFAALIAVFTYFSNTKRSKDYLSSYKLTVTNDSFIFKVDWKPELILPFSDVRRIERFEDGSFAINGRFKIHTIIIPAHIDNREELIAILTSIKPFTVKSKRPLWHMMTYTYVTD